MDKEQIEDTVDELYAMHKKTGERMIEFTAAGKSLMEQLEMDVNKYKQDMARYSFVYFWAMVASSIMIIVVSFWLFYRFDKKYNEEIKYLYYLGFRVENIIKEQNKLLETLSPEKLKNKNIKK